MTQPVAAPPEKAPAGQSGQVAAAGLDWKDPAGQVAQNVAASLAAYAPAAQPKQVAEIEAPETAE